MTVTGNARSEPEIVTAEVAAAQELGGEMVPGTSLVMHRFSHGSLAGQPWIGADGIPVDVVDKGAREIAAALAVWTDDQKKGTSSSSIFDRNAYVPPDNIFKQMEMARTAWENDDMVGGVMDATEGLALKTVRWEGTNLDDIDMFNQWATRVDMDNLARKCWQELGIHGQYVVAAWWGFADFKVRGNGPPKMIPDPNWIGEGDPPLIPDRDKETGALKKGAKRKKVYSSVYCPLALTVLDSTKVVPVGSMMFGQETLVWTATKDEMTVWQAMADGKVPQSSDPIMARLFVGKYVPTADERAMLIKLGVKSPENLLILNPDYVWRHTLTKPDYKPWAKVPMKRVFRWLDLKQQLLAADRVSLIGNANYILLVTKGEKDAPASQAELNELNESFAYIARLPVVIGDHTLSIEIITPKQDHTLKKERYELIDSHIRDSLLSTFTQHQSGSREGASGAMITVSAIASALANRRRGLKRDFEKNIARRIFEHPFNNEQNWDDEPNLAFSPRAIELEQSQASLQALIALSARGDVSRQTTLEEALDLDQAVEAQRREMEQQWYDPVFKTATPFNGNTDPMNPGSNDGGPGNSGGAAAPPGAGGGGRPPGGGQPKATPPSPKAPRKAPAPRGKNRD